MIAFLKIRDVKSPIRNPEENAGIDLFIPEKEAYTTEELEKIGGIINENSITIMPHRDIMIPGGIKAKFDKNVAMLISNKSGIATKNKLVHGAELIDVSYQGEWIYHIYNFSDLPRTVNFGQKIVQVLPIIINTDNHVVVEDITEDQFFEKETSRGRGGFGSTGIA